MYNGLKGTLIFVLGAAVGSVVTWKVLKRQYEQIVQEEIDSFKEMMSKNHGSPMKIMAEVGEKIISEIANDAKTEKEEYEAIASEYSNNNEEKGGSDYMYGDGLITIIAPDEFGEDEDYDTESLIYYADEMLADDQGNLVEDADDLIGADFADHFGDYEDNAIYFRNDKYKVEYEVVRDYRRYGDIFDIDPNQKYEE